jgi:hypothetical protein
VTITVQNVGRTRHLFEANGSFAVEQSVGSFAECALVEGTSTVVMDRPFETPKLLQQYLHGYPSKVPMPKRASYSFSTNMRGALARSAASTTPTSASVEDFNLFTVVFGGGVQHGTGTTVATTSSTTVVNATSAAGFLAGGAIVCATGTGGALECREIKSISSNAITLKRAFTNAPANGSVIYACSTFYLNALDGGSILSLQTIVEGLGTIDRWLLLGGHISAPPVFKLAPGTIPTVDWAFQYANHLRADGSETTMNLNSALSDQAYADTSINAVMDSEFCLTAHAGTTGTVIHASEINIVPNLAVEPHTTPGGTNNIKQWVPSRVDGPPVTANFLDPYEAVTWRTARDAETAYALSYQVGASLTGGGFMISVPFVTVDNFQREAVGGLAGERVSLYARQDTQTSANTSAQAKSPFRVHFF